MKLRWTRPALDDLVELRRFVADANPAAAVSAVARIRRSTARLQQFPASGAPLDVADLRATTVPGTPYRIIYRVVTDVVLIIAVWHGARQWPPARD